MPKILRVENILIHPRRNTLFKTQNNYTPRVIDDGAHITKNLKLNSLSELALNLIDKITPFIRNHPKFGKYIGLSCEKFIIAINNLGKY